MELRIFQSDKGDCLLLSGDAGGRILCDGGMYTAMARVVAPELAKLRGDGPGPDIDAVYVSHIDQDHISGVLQLLRNEIAWRIHDFREKTGQGGPKPDVPRPPRFGGLWHNAFRDQVGDNAASIVDFAAASAPVLALTRLPTLELASEEMQNVATSVTEALEVSKLVDASLLNIPVNRLPGHEGEPKLLMIRDGEIVSTQVGSLKLTVVGPSVRELQKLKDGWNNWLRDNRTTVEKLRARIAEQIDEFSQTSDLSALDFALWEGVPDYKRVTIPNIASLMFLVEEDGRTLLLTGDSHHDIILEGLRATGFLGDAGIHLDILKLQHHGSEYNCSSEFARQVTADHYVICGNGEHDNPDVRVLQMLFDSRMSADPAVRGLAPEAADQREFHFWFSTSTSTNESKKGQAYWAVIVQKVAEFEAQSQGRLKVHYNDGAYATLAV